MASVAFAHLHVQASGSHEVLRQRRWGDTRAGGTAGGPAAGRGIGSPGVKKSAGSGKLPVLRNGEFPPRGLRGGPEG